MLSTTTEYALRALAYLAAVPAGESLRSGELAKQTGIPANYLSKILHTLRNAGLLDAARGVGGGYRLSRAPSKIRLIDIAELFDGVHAVPQCILGSGHECTDGDPCSAHEEWGKVRVSYIRFLEQTTLRDIAANRAGRHFHDFSHPRAPKRAPGGTA